MIKLVLLRHGQSQWNLDNRFTGWTDVDITDAGAAEAHAAGKLLAAEGFKFDIALTSVLKRAIRTLWITLDEFCPWNCIHRDRVRRDPRQAIVSCNSRSLSAGPLSSSLLPLEGLYKTLPYLDRDQSGPRDESGNCDRVVPSDLVALLKIISIWEIPSYLSAGCSGSASSGRGPTR